MATFREVARHILDASDGLTGMLLAGDENLRGGDFRERLKRHMRGAAGRCGTPPNWPTPCGNLWPNAPNKLAVRPPEFFARMITRFDGQQVTRLEMVQTVKSTN